MRRGFREKENRCFAPCGESKHREIRANRCGGFALFIVGRLPRSGRRQDGTGTMVSWPSTPRPLCSSSPPLLSPQLRRIEEGGRTHDGAGHSPGAAGHDDCASTGERGCSLPADAGGAVGIASSPPGLMIERFHWR
jgi:hypothetical protein